MPAFEGSRDYTEAPQDPQTVLTAANRAVPQALNAVLKSVPPTLQDNSPISRPLSFPAPVLGVKDAVVGSDPSAIAMRNFWPTDRGLEVRRGYRILHDFGRTDDPLALIPHEFTDEVLVVYPDAIFAYQINTGILRQLSVGPSGGVISSVAMRTELGVITVMVNGIDPMIVYNGSDTAEITQLKIDSPLPLSNSFLDTRTITVAWLYGKRTFIAGRGINSAWYFSINAVPIDDDQIEQITELPLGNIFPRGGLLSGGFSWSVDVGDNLNNRCVFTSDQGEFAIYSGDPDIDFVLDGLYVSGSLLSKNTLFSVGGDAYMLLNTGFKLLSEIVQGAPQGGELGSLEEGSYLALRKTLKLRGAVPGQHIVSYFRLLDMALLIEKGASGSVVVAYNTKLKSWSVFGSFVDGVHQGWNIRAVTAFGNTHLLFLNETGKLCEGWRGRSDGWQLGIGGTNYTAFARYTFSPMQELAYKKTVTGVQGVWDNTTKMCPVYQMVGYRGKKEVDDPPPCPPEANNPLWPTLISLSVGDLRVGESIGNARFRVTLSEISNVDVTFNATTADGTALAVVDYTPVAVVGVTIPAGSLSVEVPVAIIDDGVSEGEENFSLVISQSVGARILDDRGVCTIVDNDFVPSPDPMGGGFTSSSLDVRAFSMIGPLTYKIGGSDGAGAFGPNTNGAFAFDYVELDGEGHDIEGKRVPTFVAFDFNHADGTVPVWAAYVITDEDIASLEAAGNVVANDLRPPAHSVRGWRALIVQMWDTDDGRPEGYTLPEHSVIESVDNVSVGDLLSEQTVSPYVGHVIAQQSLSDLKGMWLSHGGEFWVHDPANNTGNIGFPGDPDIYDTRNFAVFRPMAEVTVVRSQIAQDFAPPAAGYRGLLYFFLDGHNDGDQDTDPPFSLVVSSSVVGRWFPATMRIHDEGGLLPFPIRTWILGPQIPAPDNVIPADIPADYEDD